MSWTDGQRLGLEQLEDIEAAANGHFTVGEGSDPRADGAPAVVQITLTTRHIPRAKGGLPLRAREKFVVHIPARFPLEYPTIHTAHNRWTGFPHVQWGSQLCLYQSPNLEYVPSDGMFGFVDRLRTWLAAGALGQLDPDDAPLHPPAVSATADECIVVQTNAPSPAEDYFWLGSARLAYRHQYRLDLTAWRNLDDSFESIGENERVAAAIILNKPLPFEYPQTVAALMGQLLEQGMSVELQLKFMRLFSIGGKDDAPLYFVVGAPMRRLEAGGELKTHIAVWRVDPDAARWLRESLQSEDMALDDAFYDWALTAKTTWCRVYEARPEVTIRRDINSRASWLSGKKVLLLGSGAIGSQVGEYVVRAGAGRVDIADNGVVGPGILVRQNFVDWDVGFSKAHGLERRLKAINPNLASEVHRKNLARGIRSQIALSDFDLIIDATASNFVATALEQEIAATPLPCPLISLSVSAKAEFGMVMTAMPRAGCGPLQLARRAKFAIFREGPAVFVDAFWPKREDVKLFQPEPGCSEPTFTGSAIDLAIHTSALLNLAIERIELLPADSSSADFIAAPSIRFPQRPSHRAFVFKPPSITTDGRNNFRVVIAPEAKQEMLAWIARNKRVRGEHVETGGLLFGAIDESLKTIWFDRASGPPPDSIASEENFVCGTEGTQALTEHHSRVSGRSSGFIGIWHTHPVSRPDPSTDDLSAMAQLLVLERRPPRHTLMVIVGFAADKPQLAAYLFHRRDIQIFLPGHWLGQ